MLDIFRHPLIEKRLGVRQWVDRCIRPTLGEQSRTVELEQLLFDQSPHHVRYIGHVRCIAWLALKTIRVEQRKEKLEILIDTCMRRRGHEKEMTGYRSSQSAELVALRLLDLAPDIMRRQLVCLIDNDQVPVGGRELRLQVLITG